MGVSARLSGLLWVTLLWLMVSGAAGHYSHRRLKWDPQYLDGTYVRSPRDVTDPVVVEKAFHKKMALLTTEDIAGAVDAAVDKTNVSKDLLLRTTMIASQWGTLQSLENVKTALKYLGVKAITSGADASLADVLYYLYHKKCDEGVSEWLAEIDPPSGNAPLLASELPMLLHTDRVLLVDDVTLKRMPVAAYSKGTPSVAKTLVAPYGWVGGLTAFSQTQYESIIMALAKALEISGKKCRREQEEQGGSSESSLMDCSAKKALLSNRSWRGVDLNKIVWVGEAEASSFTDPSQYSARAIAQKLRVDLNYQDILDDVDSKVVGCAFRPPESVDAAGLTTMKRMEKGDYIQYLLQYGTILSMNNLASYAGIAFGAVKKRFPAKKKTVRLYCIPETHKSTSVVYHLWFMITGEDPSHLLYCPMPSGNTSIFDVATWYRPLLSQYPHKRLKVMLVDDLAISGQQQGEAYTKINQVLEYYVDVLSAGTASYRLTVVPLLYSSKAVDRYDSMNVKGLAGRSIRNSGYGSWMLGSQFGNSLSDISLPYMSPDNNNYFFANFVAPTFSSFFGCGVKGRQDTLAQIASFQYEIPPETFSELKRRMEDLLEPHCSSLAKLAEHGDKFHTDFRIMQCLETSMGDDALPYVDKSLKCYQAVRPWATDDVLHYMNDEAAKIAPGSH